MEDERLFCKLYQNLRPVISLFRQLPHLCFIHGQNRHFRTCKNRVQKDQEQPAHFMTAIRVTVTTAGFLQSAFAAEYFAQPMTEALIKTGIDVPQNVLKIVCMIIVTILLSYVSLLFGDVCSSDLWREFLFGNRTI